jgi:hypothetical protein
MDPAMLKGPPPALALELIFLGKPQHYVKDEQADSRRVYLGMFLEP